ncbi:hypothetical protein [uncultured Paludibaculum sp.]|uniref:hypothetical protein n=1 Tax=uncultured Paludibaculum sp. TaxID=1765020 RepID=UPI002AAC1637|nr:hypothetical protein [uncultured Paludibaculum sp.]
MSAIILEAPFDLDAVPDRPAVFVIHAREGRPYLARTALLRRRLKRLLLPRAGHSRLLNLHDVAVRVEYHLTASRLGSSLTYYDLARRHFPDDYAHMIKLRLAPIVKILLANAFPRSTITTRLSASQAFQYGPFRSRASAERFEQEVLDLFQVRRCQEDLVVSPDHPGCIYGEMMRCLRPCQQVVGPEEYRSEVERLVHFLQTNGQSLLEPVARARDRSSEELNFEDAQRQHQRYHRIEQVLRLRDDLVADVDRLCGVGVAPSIEPGCVELLVMIKGVWLPAFEFKVAATGRESVPLDRRLRELLAGLETPRVALRERAEHISLLARWYYSSWRDTDWIEFPRLEDLPYRRLVRAISKTASAVQTSLFES